VPSLKPSDVAETGGAAHAGANLFLLARCEDTTINAAQQCCAPTKAKRLRAAELQKEEGALPTKSG